MLPDEMTDYQKNVLRTVKIIAASLIAGPAIFAAVAITATFEKQPSDATWGYMGVIGTVTILLARAIVPGQMTSAQLRQIASGECPTVLRQNQATPQLPRPTTTVDYLCGVYQQKVIVENAIVEGAAFLNLFIYMMIGQWWCAAIAGAMIAILILTFPTQSKAEGWVEDQLQLINMHQ